MEPISLISQRSVQSEDRVSQFVGDQERYLPDPQPAARSTSLQGLSYMDEPPRRAGQKLTAPVQKNLQLSYPAPGEEFSRSWTLQCTPHFLPLSSDGSVVSSIRDEGGECGTYHVGGEPCRGGSQPRGGATLGGAARLGNSLLTGVALIKPTVPLKS